MLICGHDYGYTYSYLYTPLVRDTQRTGRRLPLKDPDGHEEIFCGDIPQPGHFDYDLRINIMDESGINISVVPLTCPDAYWGTENVPCLAAQESDDTMAEAQATFPDWIRWFISLPWQYREKTVEALERTCANGAACVMVLANIHDVLMMGPLHHLAGYRRQIFTGPFTFN